MPTARTRRFCCTITMTSTAMIADCRAIPKCRAALPGSKWSKRAKAVAAAPEVVTYADLTTFPELRQDLAVIAADDVSADRVLDVFAKEGFGQAAVIGRVTDEVEPAIRIV